MSALRSFSSIEEFVDVHSTFLLLIVLLHRQVTGLWLLASFRHSRMMAI
jgi:hypothetical protein